MFSESVALLNDLDGQVQPELLRVLRNLLGNCQQVLTHRGEINLDWSPEPANSVFNFNGGKSNAFGVGDFVRQTCGFRRWRLDRSSK